MQSDLLDNLLLFLAWYFLFSIISHRDGTVNSCLLLGAKTLIHLSAHRRPRMWESLRVLLDSWNTLCTPTMCQVVHQVPEGINIPLFPHKNKLKRLDNFPLELRERYLSKAHK